MSYVGCGEGLRVIRSFAMGRDFAAVNGGCRNTRVSGEQRSSMWFGWSYTLTKNEGSGILHARTSVLENSDRNILIII